MSESCPQCGDTLRPGEIETCFGCTSEAIRDAADGTCPRCGEDFIEGWGGTFCSDCETERLNKKTEQIPFSERLEMLRQIGPITEAPPPVVIDLQAEGNAIAIMLGALSELGDASKERVLETVTTLVARPKSFELSSLVRQPKNDEYGFDVQGRNFQFLNALQGAERDDGDDAP